MLLRSNVLVVSYDSPSFPVLITNFTVFSKCLLSTKCIRLINITISMTFSDVFRNNVHFFISSGQEIKYIHLIIFIANHIIIYTYIIYIIYQ